jgi:hypothetical protein
LLSVFIEDIAFVVKGLVLKDSLVFLEDLGAFLAFGNKITFSRGFTSLATVSCLGLNQFENRLTA